LAEKVPISPLSYNLVLLNDSAPLPFEDQSFDIISSHGVLHHIIDPIPVIKELNRVCKIGGFIYVMLYSNIMEDYFNEMGLINKFMRENGISYNEAFGWCTDGPGTPYSRSYSVEQGAEFLEDIGHFQLIDFNYWLNDHFITYKAKKVE
jgi:ubiquinone/menaquinone biosynthesis C-methylase UbiE